MNVEEEYLDVLQNIESIVNELAQADTALSDYEVEKVYNGLIVHYSAQAAHKSAAPFSGEERTRYLFMRVKGMCDFRLGQLEGQPLPQDIEPVELRAMMACLKRLRKSVQFWTKEGGRKGYLTYISNFL